ncbi:MAG: NAD(P)H-quinone oxidoreductase [Lentisphaeria bacterium]|nr:NAD(P)H-quinone oxidoreductase [Lentisphaeria bacterium]
MYAMILDEQRNFQWKELPDPARKEGEVLIKVEAAAVNRADLMQKDGCYSSPPDWPQWCGLECAGTILEAGENSRFKKGDKVCALLGGGGYSQIVAVPEGMVLPVPQGLSMVESAAIPEVWSTVYLNMVKEAGGIKKGDTVFVQAGASGVGLACIQFAKFSGGTVITTVSGEEKAQAVKKAGADIVVNYKKESLEAVLEKNPPDIALDCVAGKGMGECFRHMKFCGRWIMIASMAGGPTRIDLEQVWRKRLKLIGSTLRSRTSEEKARILSALEKELWEAFSKRTLSTNVFASFPINEVEKAHAELRNSRNIGKVVLVLA